LDMQGGNLGTSANEVAGALKLEPKNAAALGMKTALAARGQTVP